MLQVFVRVGQVILLLAATACMTVISSAMPDCFVCSLACTQNDGSVDFLSFCGKQYPANIRAAAFVAYCRVHIERTPWDSNASVLDGDDDEPDAIEVSHEFASRRALELLERKTQWLCHLSRAISLLADDVCPVFQTLAVRALYDMQVCVCSSNDAAK